MRLDDLFNVTIDWAKNLVRVISPEQWKTKFLLSTAVGALKGYGAQGILMLPIVQQLLPKAQMLGIYDPKTGQVNVPILISSIEESMEFLPQEIRVDLPLVAPIYLSRQDVQSWISRIKEVNYGTQNGYQGSGSPVGSMGGAT
jgi:hypothetical protein